MTPATPAAREHAMSDAHDEKPRPILDLFREGYDIKTIADVSGCPEEHVEHVLRKALTNIGGER